jgi:hypothetical protein
MLGEAVRHMPNTDSLNQNNNVYIIPYTDVLALESTCPVSPHVRLLRIGACKEYVYPPDRLPGRTDLACGVKFLFRGRLVA